MPHPIFSLLAQSHEKCLRADSVDLGKRRLAKSRSASAASPDEINVFKAGSASQEAAAAHSGPQESAFHPASEHAVQADSSETAQTAFCPIEIDSIRADSIVLARARGVAIHKKVPSAKSIFHSGGVSGPVANVFAFPRRARPNSAQPGMHTPGMFEARSCPPTAEGNRYRRRASESESYEAVSAEKHHNKGAMGLVDFIKRHFVHHPSPEQNTRSFRSASSHATPGASRTTSPGRHLQGSGDGEGGSHHGTEKGKDPTHGSQNWFSRVSGKMSRKSIELGSGTTSPKQISNSQAPSLPLHLHTMSQPKQASSTPERAQSQPLVQEQQWVLSQPEAAEMGSGTDTDVTASVAGTPSLGGSHGSALPQVAK